MNKIVRVEAY